jgi:hypothetical protein
LATTIDSPAPEPVAGATPPRVDPTALLPGVDPDAPMDVERARALQEAVRVAREQANDGLLRERIACYRRFFVYRCWADVDAREREARGRLDRIEVAANRTLREARALELNERLAADLAERARVAGSDAERREENLRSHEARRAAAEAEAARREAEAPALAERAQANRAERARREAEVRARREEAERRAGQDAENAAARARMLEARQREREAAERREAERREARRADRERREAEARQRAEQPPSRRPGARGSARSDGTTGSAQPVPLPDPPPRTAPALPQAPGTPEAPTVTPMR